MLPLKGNLTLFLPTTLSMETLVLLEFRGRKEFRPLKAYCGRVIQTKMHFWKTLQPNMSKMATLTPHFFSPKYPL